MVALATASDLATYLQRDLSAEETATAELVLGVVSAAIRSYTGQSITTTTSTAVRLKVKGNKVRLPQGPVTAVSAVADTGGNALTFTWFSGQTLWVTSPYVFAINTLYDGPSYVDVTYTHGYAAGSEFLEPAKFAALRAAKALMGDADPKSETIGSYSVSYDDAKREVEKSSSMLDRYKVPALPIVMERA